MSSDTKLILSLVNRVAVKLPSTSGKKLGSLESDPLIQLSALIDLAKFRLPTVVNTLVAVLEGLSKDHASFTILQSQLCLLRIIAACMQQHWIHLRDTSKGDNENVLPDPAPLDDNLAKYITSIMSRFMDQMITKDEWDSHLVSSQANNFARAEYAMSYEATTPTDVMSDIYKAASRIIFYISASNWPVLFARIKIRIQHLSSTSDDKGDTTNVRLLECSALNAERLSMVMKLLCATFLHVKKSSQLVVAMALHRGIWNWIETYPSEFQRFSEEQKRLDGGPEILFDICYSLADSYSRKSVLWPLQMQLLVLCPDVLESLTTSERTERQNKKAAFVAMLRESLRSGRMAELAAICFVEMCKAAAFVPKNEATALRSISVDAPELIKDKLFDIHNFLATDRRQGSLGIHVDQRGLLADAIVALFRFNPDDAITSLIPTCMDENAPILFKRSLVKACLALADEVNHLPWNPPFSILYDCLCVPLRRLFLQLVGSDSMKNDNSSNPSSTALPSRKTIIPVNMDKKKKVVHHDSTARSELVLDIMRLYQTDPKLAIMGAKDELFELNEKVIVAMAHCLRNPNRTVCFAAAECLNKLHQPHHIMEWGPDHRFMESFWFISSKVVFYIAKQLLESRGRNGGRLRRLLTLLKRLLQHRNDFLRIHQDMDMASHGSDSRERLQCAIGLEVALLVLLCSSNANICTAGIECFGLVCEEANITERVDEPATISLLYIDNLPVYTELTKTDYVTGRKSQQKWIRRLMRAMTRCTPGNLAAWEEVWKRWKYLTPSITCVGEETLKEDVDTAKKSGGWHDRLRNYPKQSNTYTPSAAAIDDDTNTEWQNYGGFLASLGGICLMNESPSISPAMSSRSSSNSDHRHVPAPTESAAMVDYFLKEMVELLVCDHIIVREWVGEILGTDLSPTLYHILFRYLKFTLEGCFGTDNNINSGPKCTLFVEQVISVLKLLLDRLDDTGNLLAVDFSGIISRCADYLNRLGNGPLSMKIKIKMCQLCEVMMTRKDSVTLRQEFKLRNSLVGIIVQWTSDLTQVHNHVNEQYDFAAGHKQESRSNSYLSVEFKRLQNDLDLACLKTMVALLNQLPLQPWESVHETGAREVKSKIFYKYFTFFLRLLNRCRVSQNDSDKPRVRKSGGLDSIASSLSTESKHLASLKNYTILALSNLLGANIDTGLKFSLSMGYHEDNRIRAAFMQVLTNVLNQGTEFETLAETVLTDRYEKLVDMLVGPDHNLAMSLLDVCPMSEIDKVANVLLLCFSSRGRILELLKAVIEKEVQDTDSETDLFRKTSVATRLLSVYLKNNAAGYLRSVLQPAFEELMAKPRNNLTFEIDPSKTEVGEEAAVNKKHVVEATDTMLTAICASANEAPRSFRQICHFISSAVNERFPEAKHPAVGAFVFLRFFCPAIVSPESEGLVKSNAGVTRGMRRGFLIATKVIQNLANNVLFGAKETYMIILNDYLTANIYRVTTFLRELAEVSLLAEGPEEVAMSRMSDKEYALLHNVLSENIERMSRDVATRRLRHLNDEESLSALKRSFDKFATRLAQLGRPPELPDQGLALLQKHSFTPSNQLYAEFMQRNGNRSVDAIASKSIFYEGGPSKAGWPVFYYVARHVIADSIDFELLVYYVLQTVERVANKPFEVLLDMTQFGPSNSVPVQWISQLLQLMPPQTSENLVQIYVFNPNTYLRRFLKKLLSRPVRHKIEKRIVFSVMLPELYEYIAPTETRLPISTVKLETDQSHIFHPVRRMISLETHTLVTVKVGAEYVQVTTARKQEIAYGMSAITNDVFHISEIEDIVVGPHRRSSKPHHEDESQAASEFSFKYNRDKLQVLFSSAKRDAIVTAIQLSKNQYESLQPASISERAVRPNDVPGRLLSMSLLNSGSDDPALRLASYNLLYSLIRTFNFSIGRQLLDAKDLCLPANSTDFIVYISEKLAISQPDLTLEVLNECLVGFTKSDESQRYICLIYMIPWLPNLARYKHESPEDQAKAKEVLRMLIDLTVSHNMYKLVQANVWRTLSRMDAILNMILTAFVQFSVEHGVGSSQSEAMADTFVTLSSVSARGKLISRLRRVIHKTSFKPSRSLTEHATWTEIAILVRFVLMASFNNRGPIKCYVPELFHVVSQIVGSGPTIVRASIHGLVVNIIQSLCTSIPLPDANVKKLQLLLTDLSDSRSRLLFGLTKPDVNAFTIIPETLTDTTELQDLSSLEVVVNMLLEVLNVGSPNVDVANLWRARWMSLVVSTAFQFNPAIQPRAFVVLGCLGREEVDDDLLYQILIALRGALAIFDASDPNLVLSIIMCLKNIVESLPNDSRYILQLFWVAIALVQLNNGPTFSAAVELVQAVLRALDGRALFAGQSMADVLLAARSSMKEAGQQLDRLCGVNFEMYFSFAIACVFLKGWRYTDAKDIVYQGLTTFLDIECRLEPSSSATASTLGYVTGLLPIAAKNQSLREILTLAGLSHVHVETSGVFENLDVTDNTTALLVISLLETQLGSADNEPERLFIYRMLAEAATARPDVFALVYDALLPKMNQIVISSHSQEVLESVQSILMIACSDPVFRKARSNEESQKVLLEQIGFTALDDPVFGAASTNTVQNAQLASDIIGHMVA